MAAADFFMDSSTKPEFRGILSVVVYYSQDFEWLNGVMKHMVYH